MIKVTFADSSAKAKKTYDLALTADTELNGCSVQLQFMVLAAVELVTGFTLDELTNKAIALGLTTTQTDVSKIGAWHRPKLISMGVIKAYKKPAKVVTTEELETVVDVDLNLED